MRSRCMQVIADITRRMGAGMAEFIPKEVTTTVEYNKYGPAHPPSVTL